MVIHSGSAMMGGAPREKRGQLILGRAEVEIFLERVLDVHADSDRQTVISIYRGGTTQNERGVGADNGGAVEPVE